MASFGGLKTLLATKATCRVGKSHDQINLPILRALSHCLNKFLQLENQMLSEYICTVPIENDLGPSVRLYSIS